MKLQIDVIVPGTEDTQPLSVEVEGDMATFYLGGKEVFGTDYTANFEEFIIGMLKLWSESTTSTSNHKDKMEAKE